MRAQDDLYSGTPNKKQVGCPDFCKDRRYDDGGVIFGEEGGRLAGGLAVELHGDKALGWLPGSGGLPGPQLIKELHMAQEGLAVGCVG